MKTVIEVAGLVKRFGNVTAVAGIDFQIQAGEVFGFLGPNGAGKTTTINMLTGLAKPDSGTIRIAGNDVIHNPKAAQRLMGIVPDESNLYPELTGYDNLCFCGALYGMRKAEREARARDLLDTFGLVEAGGRKFAGYSKGMKRKLTIAAGIIHSPSILFLDEPTTGIDVAAARQIRKFIGELNAAGTTIFLTTHYIEEAERLCSRIAFVVGGRLVRTDKVEDLMRGGEGVHGVQFALSGGVGGGGDRGSRLAKTAGTQRGEGGGDKGMSREDAKTRKEGGGEDMGSGLAKMPGRHRGEGGGGSCQDAKSAKGISDLMVEAFPNLRCRVVAEDAIRVESGEPVPIGPLVRFIEERGVEVTEARKVRLSLEEVFVRVTGIEADAMKREKEKAGGAGL